MIRPTMSHAINKDELRELMGEYASYLEDELAKANERVRELEQVNLVLAANVEACCELTEMDIGAAIERLFEIDNTESKTLLNKFAIEKKIEGAYSVISLLDPAKDSKAILMANKYIREQLRKEQSND